MKLRLGYNRLCGVHVFEIGKFNLYVCQWNFMLERVYK